MPRTPKYKPTEFMLLTSRYDKQKADYAVGFIECLTYTKGTWAGQPFHLLPWQEKIIRDVFDVVKPNGFWQFNTAYIEIPKKNGKTELDATVALLCDGFLTFHLWRFQNTTAHDSSFSPNIIRLTG